MLRQPPSSSLCLAEGSGSSANLSTEVKVGCTHPEPQSRAQAVRPGTGAADKGCPYQVSTAAVRAPTHTETERICCPCGAHRF